MAKKRAKKASLLQKIKKLAPAVVSPGLFPARAAQALRRKKKGRPIPKPISKIPKFQPGKKYTTATRYAVSGQIPFNEPYWRQQAEATWGKYAAQQLADSAAEAGLGRRSATENLALTLERIGQDRAFAGQDLQASLQELASERKWTQIELDEVLRNVTLTQQYLKEDFETATKEIAYQRGQQRSQLAEQLMPEAEKVRSEAWERGLGARGLGAVGTRAVQAARVKGIGEIAYQATEAQKRAEQEKERGITEQYQIGHRARLAAQQKGEQLGFQESTVRRNYQQALARYGLEEKGARIGYGQEIGQIGLGTTRQQRAIGQQRQIGIEEFVQARKGEAYQRAAAFPERNIYTTTRVRVPKKRPKPFRTITF